MKLLVLKKGATMKRLLFTLVMLLTITTSSPGMDFTPNPAFTENEKLEISFANAVKNALTSLPNPDVILVSFSNKNSNNLTTRINQQFPQFIKEAAENKSDKQFFVLLIGPAFENSNLIDLLKNATQKESLELFKNTSNELISGTKITYSKNLTFLIIPCAMGRNNNPFDRTSPVWGQEDMFLHGRLKKLGFFKSNMGLLHVAYKKEFLPFDPIFVPLTHYLANCLNNKKHVFIADGIAFYPEDHIVNAWTTLKISNNKLLTTDLETIKKARDKNLWCYISHKDKKIESPTLTIDTNKPIAVSMTKENFPTKWADFLYIPNPIWSCDFDRRNNDRVIAYFLADLLYNKEKADLIMVGFGVAREGNDESNITAAKPQQFPTVIANTAQKNPDKKFLLILIDGLFDREKLPTGLKDFTGSDPYWKQAEWQKDSSCQYPCGIQQYVNKNITVLVISQCMGRPPNTRFSEKWGVFLEEKKIKAGLFEILMGTNIESSKELFPNDPIFVPLVHFLALCIKNKKLILFADSTELLSKNIFKKWKSLTITENDILKQDLETFKKEESEPFCWEYFSAYENGENFPKTITWNASQNRFVVNAPTSPLQTALQLLKAKLLALAKELKT